MCGSGGFRVRVNIPSVLSCRLEISALAKRKQVKPAARKVIYRPPSANSIHQYVRIVCRELGETVDAEFDTPEAQSELVQLLRVLAAIGARQMNKNIEELDTNKPKQ